MGECDAPAASIVGRAPKSYSAAFDAYGPIKAEYERRAIFCYHAIMLDKVVC